ncbi:MAG: ATP-binding protein [Calditrichia bacterium]
MIKRQDYLNKLFIWKDKPVIKIVTGIRRSGKSTLLKMYMEELRRLGIDDSGMIYINMESLENEKFQDYKILYQHVKKRWNKKKSPLYIFIDEVQRIPSWEKVVLSFFSEKMGDIVISGSNSTLLSGELASLLAGRYVEIPVFPLTFSEFLEFREVKDPSPVLFNEYLKFGGMPGIHHLEWNQDVIYEYLNAIFDTIILKDIVARYNIRNVALLEKIIRFIFDNIANIFSANSIIEFLKKEKRKISIETIYNYLEYLKKSLVIYSAPRFDIIGKKILEFREKFFVADLGLRHSLLSFRRDDISKLMENIIFIELRKRGYRIYTGQFGDREIDFIAEKEGKIIYIQVAYLLTSEKTINREFEVLLNIPDNYPKMVVSMDQYFQEEIAGIQHIHLWDFLLNKELL